jgi:transcriptional regulator with XRE-family HTH domain
MKVGDRIRERRLKLGMTQDDLAKKLGYKSRASVNKIENDAQTLTQSKVVAMAAALNTTPLYLMGWDKPETKKAYYLDDETARIAQEIRDNPDYRVLFDAGKNLKPKDIIFIKEMIDRLKNK